MTTPGEAPAAKEPPGFRGKGCFWWPWPALVVADVVTIAVQVNGKLRGEVQAPVSAGETEVRAMAEQGPARNKLEWLRGRLGDEASELDDVLADPAVPSIVIAKYLHGRGFDISTEAVRTWAEKARRGPR